MTVSIGSPLGSTVNADPSLTVTGSDTNPNSPKVVGTLTDMSSGGSWGGSSSGTAWTITFNPGATAISDRDFLIVSVHDTGTQEGCQKSYRQDNSGWDGWSEHHHEHKGKVPKTDPVDCGINVVLNTDSPIDLTKDGPQDFSVQVTLPKDKRTCYVFLCLLHKKEVGENSTSLAHCPIPSSPAATTVDVPFQVNFKAWDFVRVVATADGCKPNTLKLKPV